MTCIIGYRDSKNGIVYIGADSCGGNTMLAKKFIRRDRKVFKLKDDKESLIGFAGSFRMGQLLMTAEGLFDEPVIKDDEDDEDLSAEEYEDEIVKDEEDVDSTPLLDKMNIKYKRVKEVNLESMIDVFIPNTANLLLEGGFAVQGENGLEGGVFLVANKDKLYRIDGDFQVGEMEDDYIAIGTGENFALGALEAMKDSKISIPKKIEKALRVATKYAMGVEPPFIIMNTGNDEVIEIKK